ncbi:phage terminase large subunit family protein [Pseudovibrio ascidiaceicola]|uniref:phage terminase large subunit family protein n=1 Tax=Pseudovibrio ascidiaceicola TaxID=285279 RepID=UPI003D36AF1A
MKHCSPTFESDVNKVEEIFCEGLRPDPALNVSEWADLKRVLSSKASSEPGLWRTSRFPPLREIMDCMSIYSSVSEIAVMKGAQLGVTEVALNSIGYYIDHSPGPIMYVMPTENGAKRVSNTRLQPMIDDSPSLKAKINSSRSRDRTNTTLEKDFPGGVLMLNGANAPSALRNAPIRILIGDEIDAYPDSAGDEGDPYSLALVRTRNFPRRKALSLSTPTEMEVSRILTLFENGDQRYFFVPCLRCGERHPIKWGNIKYLEGRPETAVYSCPSCSHAHAEKDKAVLLAEGGWQPTATSSAPYRRSYHLSALYSPWQSWEQTVRDWQDTKNKYGKPIKQKLKVFINTVLGEPWEDTGERVEAENLIDLREEFGPILPDRIGLVTAGVDTQPDRLEVEVVGHGADEESWSIDYRVFWGNTSTVQVWHELDNYLQSRWPHYANPRKGMGISAVAVDTGGHNTAQAYDFVRDKHHRNIWGIKGSRIYNAPVWPKKPSFKNMGGIPLYTVGVSAVKDLIMKRISLMGSIGPGAMHFNFDRDTEYFRQLTAEEKRVKVANGEKKFFWKVLPGRRNEALDCRVYSYAALQGILQMGYRLNLLAEQAEQKALSNRQAKVEINMHGLGGVTSFSSDQPVRHKRKKPKRYGRSSLFS